MSDAKKCDRCGEFYESFVIRGEKKGGYEMKLEGCVTLPEHIGTKRFKFDLCRSCFAEMMDFLHVQRVEEKKPVGNNTPMYMDNTGFSQHDCESHHQCPVCKEDYGSWQLMHMGVENGSQFKCIKCGQTLVAPK